MHSQVEMVPKKVLIVGGSFAGLCTARHLDNYPSCDVSIVEPRDFFEYAPGILHVLAGSQSQSTIITPLSACLGKAKHIRGRFLRINATSSAAIVRDVATNSEITIDYDILVIACGVGYSSPIRPASSSLTMADRLVEVETFLKTVQRSNTILINGGGLIGVELAGELVHRYYKRKSITLLNRSPLLNALPPKAGELATKWLQARGVNVLMDELQSSSITSTNAVTVSGKRLNFDILIDCRGLPESISSSSSKDSYHPPPFDLDGYMTVNQFLQSSTIKNIFSCGDVVRHDAPGVGFAAVSSKLQSFGAPQSKPFVRNAHLAESQAEVVAHNIRCLISSSSSSPRISCGSTSSFISYPRGVFNSPLCPVLSCVSLGPQHAIVVFNNLVVGGFLLSRVCALVKFIIERSKIAEIQRRIWGRLLWAFGHVVTNILHAFSLRNGKYKSGSAGNPAAPAASRLA